MADIFISYKREEQPLAKKLADALQMKGWSVWWDPEVRAGERFDDVIDKALKECKCVVVLWSKLSVESQNVKDEATYALNHDKLVPISIEEVDLPYRFSRFNTRQLIDWDGSDTSAEFLSLVDDIAKIISAPTTKSDESRTKQDELRLKQDLESQHREKERERKKAKEQHKPTIEQELREEGDLQAAQLKAFFESTVATEVRSAITTLILIGLVFGIAALLSLSAGSGRSGDERAVWALLVFVLAFPFYLYRLARRGHFISVLLGIGAIVIYGYLMFGIFSDMLSSP